MIETVGSDFHVVDGMQRSFVSTQTDLHTGKWLQTTTVKAIRKLPGLPDRLFVPGAAGEAHLDGVQPSPETVDEGFSAALRDPR